MALRYLRRPPKLTAKNAAHRDEGRKPNAPSRKSRQFVPVYDNANAPAPAVEVTPEEREKLAHALAYFCVACGREHTSAEVRGTDFRCAEVEIIAAIKHVP